MKLLYIIYNLLTSKYIQTNSMIKDKKIKEGKLTTDKSSCKMALLRIKKDLAAYQQQASDVKFVKLTFPDPESIQHIQITIKPQQNSPYRFTQVSFSVTFPDSYPIDPPKLKCLNKIFHPNINYNGSVCLPLVREDWSPTTSLFSIVCGLIFILSYPNSEDALEPEIGKTMEQDYKIYEKIVEYTGMGRIYNGKEYDNIYLENRKKQEEVDDLNGEN